MQHKRPIIEKYPLEKLEEYKDHHRLRVFYHKGVTCQICQEKVGAYLGLTIDGGGGRHVDVYTEDGTMMNVDHIIAKCDGGKNELENLRPTCEPCNHERHAKKRMTPLEKYVVYKNETDNNLLAKIKKYKQDFQFYCNAIENSHTHYSYMLVKTARKTGLTELDIKFEKNEKGDLIKIMVLCDKNCDAFVELIQTKIRCNSVDIQHVGDKAWIEFDVRRSPKRIARVEEKLRQLKLKELEVKLSKEEIFDKNRRKVLVKINAFKQNFKHYHNDLIEIHPEYAFLIAKKAYEAGIERLHVQASQNEGKLKQIFITFDKNDDKFKNHLKKYISNKKVEEIPMQDSQMLRFTVKH